MALTDLVVRKLKKRKKRYEVLDANGLYIRVMPSGAKSWAYRYNFERKARRMTLGAYPGISLAEAHEKHSVATQSVQRGIDPGAEAQREKAKYKAEPTVNDLLAEFWEVELEKTPSGKERRRLVEKDALPAWGKRKAGSITRRDAVLLIDKVRKRAKVTANRLQGVLARMFNFAAERGILENSPLAGMRRAKEKPRDRVLNDDEIKSLWPALDLENLTIDIYRQTKLALKMILLTGQRPGEVAGMRWDEIQNDLWIIPETRAKNGEVNRVPLLPMVLGVIERAAALSADTPFVFTSSYKPEQPMTVNAMARAVNRHREEIGIKNRFTPHDLRRTLRTKLAEIGVSDVIGEKVLGHKLQGVLAVYNRHHYDVEKRQALESWELKLKRILGIEPEETKVIPMRSNHRG